MRWRWAHGYLRELEPGGSGALDLDAHAPKDLAPSLVDLLAHPSARMLERLGLGVLDRAGRRNVARVLDRIVEARLPLLRRLELGLAPSSMTGKIGELGPLAQLDSLRSLRVHGEARVPALARLEQLELDVPEIDLSLLQCLRTPSWPSLRRLWITSERNNPWSGNRTRFAALLDVTPLRELAIQGSTGLSELLELDNLGQLDELRVIKPRDAEVQLLLSRLPSIAGIARIVLAAPRLEHTHDRVRAQLGDRLHIVRGPFTEVVPSTDLAVG